MSKQSMTKSRRKLIQPIFHVQNKEDDNKQLSTALLKNTRQTGQLNLSGRNLQIIPDKLWQLYNPDKEETSVNYELCTSEDQPWWNYKPLNSLDLSSNALMEIPSQLGMFEDLTVLNLQDNNLTTLPNELSKLSKLTKLCLGHNKLTEIPNCVYKLTELKILLVPHNNIEVISTEIGDLVMLQQLDVSHNSITLLPPGLGYLVRLTQANLSYNKLIELPPDIVNLRVLLKLDLTYNELVALPALGELRKLEILYATHNNIETLPDFEGCQCIQELHFGNNYITEIAANFCETMSHLKILDLRDNKLEELPNELLYMQQLIRLDVSNNSLINLPNSLSTLSHLQSLQVDGNKIRSIRRDILQGGTSRILKFLKGRLLAENENIVPEIDVQTNCNFPDRFVMRTVRALNLTMKELTSVPDEVFNEAAQAQITSVDLCSNKFKEIPSGLQVLSEQVTELNFSINLLAKLPAFLSTFNRLQYINVANNCLDDLPASFADLKYLRELVLSTNRFSVLPNCIYEMESLEILLARDNKINEIDAHNLNKLKRLAVLDLANNNLKYIPPELGNLMQLRSLEITGNSFRQPRYAILTKGTDAILAYLRDKIPK